MSGDSHRLARTSHWANFLAQHYGIQAALKPLVGYEDLNFYCVTEAGGVILKVMRAGCEQVLVDVQTAALTQIAANAPELPVPRVVPGLLGEFSITFPDEHGVERIAWVLTALPGIPLGDARARPLALFATLGALIAQLDRALAGFDHTALDRDLSWNLQQAGWVTGELDVVEDDRRRELLRRIQEDFTALRPALAREPAIAIHNDVNEYNVLVETNSDGKAAISALIDFGDITRAPAVCELAISGAYMVLDQEHPLRVLETLVAGYHGLSPLTGKQIDMIWPLLLTRLSVSIVSAIIASRGRPDDPYLTVSMAPAWRFVEQAGDWNRALVTGRIRAACGLPVSDGAAATSAFLEGRRGDFAQVLNRDLGLLKSSVLSVAGSLMPRDPLQLRDTEARNLAPDGSIGGYREPRLFDAGPNVRGVGDGIGGGRTVHLGVDIFAPAGSAVAAPVAGTVRLAGVFSSRDNETGRVVLAHEDAAGGQFFTLYGHLDPASLAKLQSGQRIAAGEVFARLGAYETNGGWAPHLHFQLFMIDAGAINWPVAAEPDERGWWQALCPNPASLLNLDDEAVAYQPLEESAIALAREDRFGTNLKLSYDKPCLFVRGWRHHLFDEWGRSFLDAYNNVPHVGHAHPRIAEVAADQLARINSNTRYLHPAQTEFADILLARLPAHLEVCFFVNSGSEANELALRLARAHTGGRDMIAIDHGYHGHTTGSIDISAYKFDKPNGGGAPDWVQIVPVADTYRGEHRGADAAARYAGEIDLALARIVDRGGRLAGFIAETFPSVGGQIVLPPGYLSAVYDKVRAAGGVTIADEVQTGLGRLGSHYWGFEVHKASPDIVVLGKPLGNGHPIGAVVTTRAIAGSFDNGIEFFSTFGGSTLSCRIGAEVIRIVDEEGLQANALTVGNHLIEGLDALRERHEIIGDVRGLGLFLGLDLVLDRATRAPARLKAAYIKNRLREERVLVGTEGPDDNVLKIRPPLTFGTADADLLLRRLDRVLGETELF
jgi:4-aminobutyrate aminotransferase-like enzyme/Ser/Thr protein kinase RdoA (MazF antagonist)/murein DD-endopeptidase MepM/ murein hydrolase activator NlpD